MGSYIPVLVCSSRKTKDWFCYKGQDVKFAASPQRAPKDAFTYYKPDDPIPGENKTWRDLVLEQNHPGLVPAYCLYSRDIYRDLYHEFDNRFYILSAGWGIIRAGFKIPAYNITYSTAPKMPKHARRRDDQGWKDINHLKKDCENFDRNSKIILFAGSDYVPHFCAMTQSIPHRKKILYNSEKTRRLSEQWPDFDFAPFPSSNNIGWVYEAADNFLKENSWNHST
jgi:hypothetical protein